MTELIALYDLAEQSDVGVEGFPMPHTKSVSVLSPETGKTYIGMDYTQLRSETQELIHLAHELGHCLSGAFYNRYSRLDIMAKHERTAWKWAVRELLPEDRLHEAVRAGNYEVWELAEYFNLPQPLVEWAICYYEGIE